MSFKFRAFLIILIALNILSSIAFAQTHLLSEITNVSYAGVLALPLITAFRRKRKLTFDIDVASVHVWMEKDARKKEAKDFFNFLRLKEKEFELIASKHTLDQIATWKNKTIVSKLISLFKDFCKTVDPDKIIRNFEKERGIKIKEFSENFAKEAKIKTEDALAIIVYSLLGAEYFVTFNKKHLRNKYAKLKEVGWKFGIEIPEIMLPHEFVSLFSKLSEQSSRSFSSKHDSKLNRILFSSFKPSFHNFKLTSSIFKTLLSVITLTLFSSLAFAQTQSHPLSEITPIDVNLDMFQKNITNVSYVGIGLISPLHPLDVAGSGRISSNLYIGTAGRYLYDTGSAIGLSSGLLLGGNLNLNSFSLIAGNWINASNFNVSNQLCLGGTCKTTWPSSLVGGSGTANYIPIWTASDSLGNSLLNQTQGNLWLISGNLNILSGSLQIAGTNVIDPSRNLVGINQVGQNLNFGGSYSAYNLAWVNASNLNVSNALYAQNIYECGISLASKYVPQTRQINTGSPLTGGGFLSSDLTLDINIPTCGAEEYLTSSDGNSFACATPAPATAGGWTDEGTIVRLTTSSDSVNATTLWVNNTAGRVGIGTYNPSYALHVAGDVGWSGTLQAGTVPWARLSGYDLNVAWNNKLGWGNLTDYNLNVAWAGSLGGGNITAGSITNTQLATGIYPAITGLGVQTQNLDMGGYNITNVGYIFGNLQGTASDLQCTDCVTLGTETTGNYVAGITAGTGIVVSGTAGEGWSPTVSIDTSVVPRKNQAETISGAWTFDNDVTVNKNLRVAGNITYVNIDHIRVNGSFVPAIDNLFDLGNTTFRWRNANFAGTVTATTFSGTATDLSCTDCVALGSETSGNYVATVSAGSGITVSGADGEGSTKTVSLNYNTDLIGWENLTNYPPACPAGQAIAQLGDTLTCIDVNPSGTITGSGTATQVAFFTGTNTIGSDSGLYWDNTNKRLGIGTTAPAAKLDVNGNLSISGISGDVFKIKGASIPMGLSTEIGGTTPLLNFDINFRQSDKNTTYRGAAFRIDTRDNYPIFQWLTRAAGTTTENVQMVLTEAGNVGIGTTAPVKKLDVVGDVNATGSIYMTGALYDEGTTYYVNPASTGISANLREDIVLGSGGQIDFADETGDKAYWYSNTYGTGIESGTLTDWSNTRFRWRIGGTSVSSGTETMTLTSTGLRIGGGDASYALDVRRNLNSEGSQIAYIASNDNAIASQGTGGTWEELNWTLEGFKFNSTSWTNLAGVSLYIKRSAKANLTGWVRVRLYSDNAGVPGSVLVYGTTMYANRISTTGAWYYFGLRASLTANTNYWIIVERSGLETDDIYLDSTSGNNHVYWDGSSWIAEAKTLRYTVYAYSSRGLYAYSFGSGSPDYGMGIYGYSYTSPGVYGGSQSHYGVRGYSTNSWGGYFEGASGVYGTSYSGAGTAVQGYNPGRSGYIFYGSQAYSLFAGEGLRLDMANAFLSKVFYYDGAAFTDITTTACQSGGSAFTLLADTDDVMYFGLTAKFTQLQFDIATAGAGLSLVWEYSNGSSTWVALTPTYDETKNLTRDGIVTWADPGASWVTDTVNGVSAYWIRVRTTTAPTTAPTAYLACRSGFTGYLVRGYNAGQEKLRVDSQGRLYVANEIYPGTTTEEDGIQGSRYIYDTGSAIGINTNLYVAGSITAGSISQSGNLNMNNYDIYNVKNVNTTNLFATGNVGIGTTAPSSKLEVYDGDIEINDGAATGRYKIKGLKMFYAGDETNVSTTSTTYVLIKKLTAILNETYGIKPSYINVLARLGGSATTYMNISLPGCAPSTEISGSGTGILAKASIAVSGCAEIQPIEVYLKTTSGTGWNDIIEFYYVM